MARILKRYVIIDATWEFEEGYKVHYPNRIKPAFLEWKKVCYQPMSDTEESWNQVFLVCRNLANYTLLVNEWDAYSHGQWYISDHLQHIVRRGRIQGISIIANTRRPSLFHRDIRNSASLIVCFHLHEKEDVKYMSEWMNLPPDHIKEFLGKEEHKHWSWLFNRRTSEVKLLRPI